MNFTSIRFSAPSTPPPDFSSLMMIKQEMAVAAAAAQQISVATGPHQTIVGQHQVCPLTQLFSVVCFCFFKMSNLL